LVKKSVKQFKERKLVNLFLTTYLQGKVTSTGTEIEERIKAQPKLTREQAKSTIEGEKANRIIDSLYQEISQNRHVKKMKENFQQASDIHQRLMQKSVEVEKMPFIRETQVAELPANEKDIILAEFDGGKITMKDWFNTLCDFAPPSRPKNLNTPEGVEQLLERSMKMPLFVAEAASRGFDKDENFVKQAKGYEDMNLLGKAQREKYKDIKEPNSAELVAYFNAHKQDYAKGGAMKIDAIWCQDLKTAKTAKDEIAAGGDFKAVKQKYSLVKDIEPYETYRSSEGMFADDLFKGEPNQVVGPLKGFRGGAVKWRVVRILDKKPSEPMEYSAGVDGLLRDKIWMERRNAVMDAYNKQLLAKYKYTIYEDKIKAIDPLNVP